jgi:hypothetical protein
MDFLTRTLRIPAFLIAAIPAGVSPMARRALTTTPAGGKAKSRHEGSTAFSFRPSLTKCEAGIMPGLREATGTGDVRLLRAAPKAISDAEARKEKAA